MDKLRACSATKHKYNNRHISLKLWKSNMLFENKKGVVMGVANERSIAAGISRVLSDQGASLAFSYLPDDRGKMKQRCTKAVENYNCALIEPCDVNSDESVASFFQKVQEVFGQIDFIVHSIAFAPIEDIRCPTIEASRAGFLQAMEASAYSFIATSRAASKLLNPDGAILTLSYFGGEKVVAGYNLMGIAKAALECSIKYLAYDLGPKKIRVNGISAGPIKTLAASAVGDFGDMLGMNAAIAPLQRNVTNDDVGNCAAYLLSHMASGITGELTHVDGGYHAMGSPGYALDKWNIRPRDFS